MLTAKEKTLLASLEGEAARQGVEIVTVEVVGAKKSPVIRVYIDTPDGVGFDELSAAQTWINSIIDELDPFPGAYLLEVSSPGIDRPLRTLDHFERFVGREATVSLLQPLDGRAKFTGRIDATRGDTVIIETEGKSVSLPFGIIKKARLKGIVEFTS